MLTTDEVIWGYRYILGRDPESATLITRQSQRHADWHVFRQVLLRSPEFDRALIERVTSTKWVATDILRGERLIWLDLSDNFVSRGCLFDAYEPLETEFLRKHLQPGDVFLDIGANIGWFTLLASTLVGDAGHIHAFEPRRPTVAYLKRSISMNGLEPMVTVHQVGLDMVRGDAQLGWERGTRNPGHSFLVDGAVSATMETQSVQLVTLDGLQLNRVDVMKLDVEGAEMRVLEGGKATIEANRPFIVTELYPEQLHKVSRASPKEFIDWFKARGYRAVIIDPQRNGEEIDDFPANWHKELVSLTMLPHTDKLCGRPT